MSLKILGGLARGFPLEAPKSDATRPTSVLVRRKLFDWRQDLSGYAFIDLFAGSGAMGFEALSRGADAVYLNDEARGAFLTLKQNREKILRAFKFPEDTVVVSSSSALRWLEREFSRLGDTSHCVIYVDPPYEQHQLYAEVLEFLKQEGFQGEVWVESDRHKGPSAALITGAFHSIIKQVEQGDHFVVVGKLG